MEKLENIINIHESLIYKIATKFHDISIEDLYQAGVIGVIKAYKNYKKNQNAKFSTYAYNYIFGEMYELANNVRSIKLNKDILKTYKKIELAKSKLCQQMNKEPTIEELANFLQMNPLNIEQIYNLTNQVMSLDIEDERPIYDIIPSKNENIETKIDINNSLEKLTEEEQHIIKLRYFNEYTQQETADKLGISQVKVSRYEKKSLQKMYNYLAS